jgi:hypothetical protein
MVSKKDNQKKTAVYKSIPNLVSILPSHNIYTWLCVPELRSLLVSEGVPAKINEEDVRFTLWFTTAVVALNHVILEKIKRNTIGMHHVLAT